MVDLGDQILLKNSKCLKSLQIERECRPHYYKPNATRLGSNERQEREIARFVQNDKQAKKGVLTKQSVQFVRMLTWQVVRHMEGSYLDSWHVTWHVCSERYDNTWPNQWPPCVIYLLV
jgi:ABC-type ATPase with predicted acetyltransferase domain